MCTLEPTTILKESPPLYCLCPTVAPCVLMLIHFTAVVTQIGTKPKTFLLITGEISICECFKVILSQRYCVFCFTQDEKQRIENLGGCVTYMGCWRVNGTYSVSRAIGKSVAINHH